MSFSKISLYSAIFFSGISLSNQIAAMEEITESIKQELSALDKSIITLEMALEPAKKQACRDQKQFDICQQKREESKIPGSWSKPTTYTIDCSDLRKAYCGTKHLGTLYQYNGNKYGHLNKTFPTNGGLKEYFINGSYDRWTGIEAAIRRDKHIHKRFKNALARGERVNDVTYLQFIKKEIQNETQEIQDRNSCLSNQS